MNSREPADKEGASLEDRLIRYMQELTPSSDMELRPDTAIFATGRFDSLALVQLVIWAEAQIGAPIDPGKLDFQKDWSTVASVARFIERQQNAQKASHPRSTKAARDP